MNYATLTAGRMIAGVGTGILSSTAPMYISEVAPPNIRGALLVLEQFAIVFGIVVMYFIVRTTPTSRDHKSSLHSKTYGTRFIGNDWCYRLPFLLPILPAIMMFVFIFYLPFSPRWLAGKGRDQEALEVLCFLRRLPASDPRIQAEWITIRAEAVHNREALLMRHPGFKGSKGFVSDMKLEGHAWIDMFRSNVIRRTMIGIGIMFFQQFVGINAVSDCFSLPEGCGR
jgi:MFS family permease